VFFIKNIRIKERKDNMIGFIAGMVVCGVASIIIGNLCDECDRLEKQITELNEQIERDRAELEKYL
jgi:uncharacterized membrane-anchored protein YhcB (DUF1043 family)